MTPSTQHIGIDGCPAGWLWVQVHDDDTLTYGAALNMSMLVAQFDNLSLALLDMPIGFVDGGEERTCDRLARKALRRRSSSVFPVPCRAAVYADTYTEASQINQQHTGRKLSKQSWAITGKMREVDQLLQSGAEWRSVLQESHPELLFVQLNDGLPLAHSKRIPEGYEERLAVLGRWLPGMRDFATRTLASTPRSAFTADDLLDAAVLALCAARFRDRLISLPETPPHDALGLPMQIISLAS